MKLRNRRSLRLRGYDYSRPGGYFVTICTFDRARLFGDVFDGEVYVNDAGRMIASTWQETPRHYSGVTLDSFVVMPNHMHGIVWITSARLDSVLPSQFTMGDDSENFSLNDEFLGRTRRSAPTYSLSDIIQRFKSLTTTRYIDGVANYGWPRFRERLWHRNYYDRVLRYQSNLLGLRRYIADNPRHTRFDGS